MNIVTDRLGLVVEGGYITVFIPTTQRSFVFRVVSRANKGYEVINYGPLPFTYGESLPTYEGFATTVPADGVIPARSFNSTGKSFPLLDAFDPRDMWYLPEDYRERIFHVIQRVTPSFINIDVQIPINVSQGRFQRDRVVTGVDREFGFTRGSIEVIHFPKIHYGYRYGNTTNIDLYTLVKFIYGEYIVEIPRDPKIIFNILTRRIPSLWITMPIQIYDETIRRAFIDVYGIEGFKLYSVDKMKKALSEYGELLNMVKI